MPRSTILLVEDERTIMELVQCILEGEGHTVLPVDRGDEALSLEQTYRGPIDLLVTDVMLPGMRGDQLAERLLALRPTLRVLFMSGHVNNEAMLRRGQLARASFIRKPFDPHLLARRVQDLLAASA